MCVCTTVCVRMSERVRVSHWAVCGFSLSGGWRWDSITVWEQIAAITCAAKTVVMDDWGIF